MARTGVELLLIVLVILNGAVKMTGAEQGHLWVVEGISIGVEVGSHIVEKGSHVVENRDRFVHVGGTLSRGARCYVIDKLVLANVCGAPGEFFQALHHDFVPNAHR